MVRALDVFGASACLVVVSSSLMPIGGKPIPVYSLKNECFLKRDVIILVFEVWHVARW